MTPFSNPRTNLFCFVMTVMLIASLTACKSPEANTPDPVTLPAKETTLNKDGKSQDILITINHGYTPGHIKAKAGVPIHVTFFRNEQMPSCAKDVVIPSLNQKFSVVNQGKHEIDIPAQKPGLIPIHCGMSMMHAVIDIQ